jgi:hypothetical protein
MIPRRYGPLAYVPITRRPTLAWPDGARVALWLNRNIEFFGLDDVMPGDRVSQRLCRARWREGRAAGALQRALSTSSRKVERGELRQDPAHITDLRLN